MKSPSQNLVSPKSGFTLIELLVVISIIGLLALLAIPNLVGARERARDAKAKNDMRQLKTALRLYYNDFQAYPDDQGDIGAEGGPFLIGSTTYMKQLPATFSYIQTNGGQGFEAYVALENESDGDIQESQAHCGIVVPAEATAYYVCED